MAGHARERAHPVTLRAAWPVAALYVDPLGPYPSLVADGAWYDEQRDATTFPGDRPAVAHPPCGPWGKLAWRCKSQERSAALHALEVVRHCGGVLEHPIGSRLFEFAGIPTSPWTPERELDAWGGYTLRIPQIEWGHRAEKATIFYIVGTAELPPLPHQLGAEPFPVERMGKPERRLTPPALAWWLCAVAARCNRRRSP